MQPDDWLNMPFRFNTGCRQRFQTSRHRLQHAHDHFTLFFSFYISYIVLRSPRHRHFAARASLLPPALPPEACFISGFRFHYQGIPSSTEFLSPCYIIDY